MKPKLSTMKSETQSEFSVEAIRDRYKNRRSQKVQKKPSIFMGVWGDENTGKTTFSINCRTVDEIIDGKKVYIIDLDDNAEPIVDTYFSEEKDETVILFNNLKVLDEEGQIDDKKTEANLRGHIKMIYEDVKSNPEGTKAVIFDGLDSWLKICENIMRDHELKLDPTAKPSLFNWGLRNKRYLGLLIVFSQIPCDRYVIAHDKEKKILVDKELQTMGIIPDWEKKTPSMLSQIVQMTRHEEGITTRLSWKVLKSKINPTMLGEHGDMLKVIGSKWTFNDPAEVIEKLRDTSHVRRNKANLNDNGQGGTNLPETQKTPKSTKKVEF